jgi:hypothetical protein
LSGSVTYLPQVTPNVLSPKYTSRNGRLLWKRSLTLHCHPVYSPDGIGSDGWASA